MIGLIQYTASVPVRLRSPYASANFWDQLAAGQASDIVPAGTQVEVLLDWGYTKLDPTRQDIRFTPSGHVEIVSHGFSEGWDMQLDWVNEERRAAYANDYQALRSLNNHLSAGQVLWFPDYINYPNESVWCFAKAIHAPKRLGRQKKWTFNFSLIQIPSAQMASTLPALTSI